MADVRRSGQQDDLEPGAAWLANDAVPQALVDVTDRSRPTVVALNLPAEYSAAALGVVRGEALQPNLIADRETIAASAANYQRLVNGEIAEYQTFGQFSNPDGETVALSMTLRVSDGPNAAGNYLVVEWREVGLPFNTDLELDEDVLDVAQLVTSGALADAPIGVALVDVARNVYVTVNHAYAAFLGLPRRDLLERGIDIGRVPGAPLADNAGDALDVVRGTRDSITMTVPVPAEPEVVNTVTIHGIGERDRTSRYLLILLLHRVRTDDESDALPQPLVADPLPDRAYARAVVDADWVMRLVEPPLPALGVQRDLADRISALPSVDPADLPSLIAAADLVRSGRAPRAVVRARYRMVLPDRGYLLSECVITREPGLPDGWLLLTNYLPGESGLGDPLTARLRDITLAALAEDDGPAHGSLSATAAADAIAAEFSLTPRETEILALIVDGSRVTTIARTLHLSDGTVRNYLSAIFGKVGVRNQAELVEYVARRRGSSA